MQIFDLVESWHLSPVLFKDPLHGSLVFSVIGLDIDFLG